MPEITGTVKAKSQYGVKMQDDGEWWNWSRVEYRGEPFDTSVVAGDMVHVEYAQADNGKTYISTIAKVTTAPSDPFEPEDIRSLAPPGELVAAPAEATWGFEQKDKSIMFQTCLKAAALQWVESLRAAVELYKLSDIKPSADELNAYAAAIMGRKLPPIAEVLKNWCLQALGPDEVSFE